MDQEQVTLQTGERVVPDSPQVSCGRVWLNKVPNIYLLNAPCRSTQLAYWGDSEGLRFCSCLPLPLDVWLSVSFWEQETALWKQTRGLLVLHSQRLWGTPSVKTLDCMFNGKFWHSDWFVAHLLYQALHAKFSSSGAVWASCFWVSVVPSLGRDDHSPRESREEFKIWHLQICCRISRLNQQ